MPTEYVKKNQQLPEYIKDEFEHIVDSEIRDQLIRQLRTNGWTLESIASATDLTRERVRQISLKEAHPGIAEVTFELPNPPLKPVKTPPSYIEPHPDTLARLLELQPYAQQVRSNGAKYREEAEEYTALLNHAHINEGVTLYRLAKRLGVTHGALRFRLVRYGYKTPLTATSKVYTPINPENRASK